MPLPFNFADFVESFKAVAGTFSFRRDNAPIDCVDGLEHFVATRAAFVAQKTLYGYLHTRIGTRYPKAFENQAFAESIDIAKFHVYAACLSDLGIYAAAHALDGRSVADDAREALALGCFRRGLVDNGKDAPARFSASAAEADHVKRLQTTDWTGPALHHDNFDVSPTALLRWAPIAPELKKDDAEIVRNSIRFTWRDVREQFRTRLDAEAIFADLGKQDPLTAALTPMP